MSIIVVFPQSIYKPLFTSELREKLFFKHAFLIFSYLYKVYPNIDVSHLKSIFKANTTWTPLESDRRLIHVWKFELNDIPLDKHYFLIGHDESLVGTLAEKDKQDIIRDLIIDDFTFIHPFLVTPVTQGIKEELNVPYRYLIIDNEDQFLKLDKLFKTSTKTVKTKQNKIH